MSDRRPNCALWWQRGLFYPFWFGFMRTEDGRGGMVWLGRFHFGWQV